MRVLPQAMMSGVTSTMQAQAQATQAQMAQTQMAAQAQAVARVPVVITDCQAASSLLAILPPPPPPPPRRSLEQLFHFAVHLRLCSLS